MQENTQKNSHKICNSMRIVAKYLSSLKNNLFYMSYFASSASPELAHWHEEQPTHLMSIDTMRENIFDSTRHALEELQTFIVQEEHKIADICTHFGIHDFSHNLANKNLTGATVSLYSNGHLEIHRQGAKHATSFPVQLIA